MSLEQPREPMPDDSIAPFEILGRGTAVPDMMTKNRLSLLAKLSATEESPTVVYEEDARSMKTYRQSTADEAEIEQTARVSVMNQEASILIPN